MTGSKTKTKDQGNSKFLQRIAGKKALGPPPTPRPIIGEHPVRTLLRENADEIEEIKPEAPIRAEVPSSSTSASVAPAQTGSAPQVSEELSASNTGAVGHLKTGAGGAGSESVELDRKLRAGSAGELNTSKGTERAGAVKTRTEVSEGAPDFSRAEETVINIRKKYRLNSGEFALYRELYLMTHAVGKTECSFVASELVKSTGMLERRVRDNLRRLKKNGWLVLLEGYDFENREKAKYRVNIEPGI
ncbi:MAG: hypothetical protein H0T60_07905 [Acidobacteria bacterium]|nr:hypothetical protein [Acidobacteriota bacterium]